MSTMIAKLEEFMCAPSGSAYANEIFARMTEAGYELRKRTTTRAKQTKSPAELFHEAFIAAKQNATTTHPRWDLNPDMHVWIDLPPRLRNFRFKRADGSLSITIKNRRDHKAPAAHYWPTGTFPNDIAS